MPKPLNQAPGGAPLTPWNQAAPALRLVKANDRSSHDPDSDVVWQNGEAETDVLEVLPTAVRQRRMPRLLQPSRGLIMARRSGRRSQYKTRSHSTRPARGARDVLIIQNGRLVIIDQFLPRPLAHAPTVTPVSRTDSCDRRDIAEKRLHAVHARWAATAAWAASFGGR